MSLVNFRNFFCFFSFDFRQNLEIQTFSRWLSIRGTKFFLERYPKTFFFKMFNWVPLDGFLNGFFKIRIFYSRNLHFNLGFLSKFFLKIIPFACWAYAETFLSHTEHTKKQFYRTQSIRRTKFRICSASGKMFTVLHVQLCWAYGEMILSHPEQWFKHWLSIQGNDFIADWAYAEMFKSWISWPNRIRFSKILCYRPSGP
jgi:hypothetical protein